jgi:2-succinyl-5-enolpyruvyl-6-hydroxy-3-cyclohexene-1-carboxylate synthase
MTHYLRDMPQIAKPESHLQQTSSDHRGASVLVSTLAQLGLRDAVISPGSRNAPLIISLVSNPLIKTHIVIDERAAAHVALGIALKNGTPAAVVCTSGTAAVNHGPAIAEAFHQRVPLISITADRPVEAIGKGHGQTVFQSELFSNHTLFRATIDESHHSDNEIIEIAQEAWTSACIGGPSHLNVPFEEPLYGKSVYREIEIPALNPKSKPALTIPRSLLENGNRAILIAGPRGLWKNVVRTSLPGVSEKFSGINGDALISSGDLLASGNLLDVRDGNQITPSAIITVGLPVMSKSLRKQLTALNVPHVHVGEDGKGLDTFGSLVESVNADPCEWLKLYEGEVTIDDDFTELFIKEKTRIKSIHEHAIEGAAWSDLYAYSEVFKAIRKGFMHFANSTSARYAMLFDTINSSSGEIKLHANRGVAGIDGCTSTAVGHALTTEENVVLVSGDVAFLYDINGLASVQEMPNNIKIIVINNGGGGIFRWLDGPNEVGLLESYFEAKPKTNIKAASSFCGLTYFCAKDSESTKMKLDELMNNTGPAILEIVTDPKISSDVYKKYLKQFQNS